MTRPAPKKRHLPTSPFLPPAEVVIEQYESGDRVSHDLHGVGRVIDVEASAVTVDFGSRTIRIASPFHKLEKL
jgi:hypothetical protein